MHISSKRKGVSPFCQTCIRKLHERSVLDGRGKLTVCRSRLVFCAKPCPHPDGLNVSELVAMSRVSFTARFRMKIRGAFLRRKESSRMRFFMLIKEASQDRLNVRFSTLRTSSVLHRRSAVIALSALYPNHVIRLFCASSSRSRDEIA